MTRWFYATRRNDSCLADGVVKSFLALENDASAAQQQDLDEITRRYWAMRKAVFFKLPDESTFQQRSYMDDTEKNCFVRLTGPKLAASDMCELGDAGMLLELELGQHDFTISFMLERSLYQPVMPEADIIRSAPYVLVPDSLELPGRLVRVHTTDKPTAAVQEVVANYSHDGKPVPLIRYDKKVFV